MKKFILSALTVLFCSSMLWAQLEVQWAKSIGGDNSDMAYVLKVDSKDNVFVAGQFRSTVNFDSSSNDYVFTAGQYGDAYVQKFDSDGNVLWAKVFAGIETSERPIMTIDNEDNIYISCTFLGAIDLDPGTGEVIHNNTGPGTNIFIVKLDNNGQYVWSKSFDNISNNQYLRPTVIEVDQKGNLLLAGEFQDTVDINFGPDVLQLTSQNGGDGFLLKFDVNGNFIWAKQFEGRYSDFHTSCIVTDSENNYILGGAIKGPYTDFDPGPGVFTLATPGVNNNDLFVLKLNEDGVFKWAIKPEGFDGPNYATGDDRTHDLSVVDNDDIIFVGAFRNRINFDVNSNNFQLDSGINGGSNYAGFMTGFIAKINKNGVMSWARMIEGNNYAGSGGNSTFYNSSILLTKNDQGDVFFGYNFRGNINYKINGIVNNYVGDLNRWDFSFFELNRNNGDIQSAHFIKNEHPSFLMSTHLKNNTLYASGSYTGELLFDDDESITSAPYSSGGNNSQDGFVVKYENATLSMSDEEIEEIDIHPNPANNIINIKTKNQITAILICDSVGRLVKKITPNKRENPITFSISDLSKGMYVIQIKSGAQITTKKMVIN